MCCQVNVTKGTLSQAEIDAYVDHARQKYNRETLSMDIAVGGGGIIARVIFPPFGCRKTAGRGICFSGGNLHSLLDNF